MQKNYFKNILISFFTSAFVFIVFLYLYIFGALDGLFVKLNYFGAGTEISNIILANRSALIAFSIITLSLISASIAYEIFWDHCRMSARVILNPHPERWVGVKDPMFKQENCGMIPPLGAYLRRQDQGQNDATWGSAKVIFKSRLARSLLYGLAILYIFLLVFIDSIIIWPILLIIAFISSYLKYAAKKDRTTPDPSLTRRGNEMDNAISEYKIIRPSIPAIYLFIAIVSSLFIFFNSGNIIKNLRASNTISEPVFSRIILFNGRESDFLANAGFGIKEAAIIAGKSFKENWFLGSGQATFSYDFSKNTKGITVNVMPQAEYIEKANFNDKEIWLRLKKFNLYLLTMLATNGLLGIITYAAVLFIAIIIALHIIREVNAKGCNEKKNILVLFSFFISAIFVKLFIFNNIIILFFFWISFALLIAESRILFPDIFWKYRISKEEENINTSRFKIFPFFDILFALLLFATVVFGVKAYRQWKGESNYYEYLRNKPSAKDNLEKAISLNLQKEEYLADYAKNSLDKINIELKKNQEDQDVSIITNEAVKAIEKVKSNVLNHPFSVRVFEAQGDFYSAVFPFVKKGGGDAIIKSFEKAIELEPNNPRFIMELGKAYYLSGKEDGVDNGKINKAIDCFNKIINSCGQNDDFLKLDSFSDMICLKDQDARIYLAKSLEVRGSKSEAIEELEKAGNVGDFFTEKNSDMLFELARLYFNNNNFDKANEILLKVLEINPDNANALYTLANLYEKNGEKDKAFLLLSRVLELNPDNEDVKAKVAGYNLK